MSTTPRSDLPTGSAVTETRRAARRNVTKRAATIVSTSFFLSTIGEAPLWLSMVFLAHELAAHVIPFLFVVSMGTLLASVLRATFRVADVAGSSWVMTPARVVIYVDDLAVVYSHDDEHSLYRDFIAALESRWNVEDEGELTDLIRAKRPLRASLLSLTVLGVPQSTKGELGAAFWHELPNMSGFVHVDSPRGQSNGPRLATTT